MCRASLNGDFLFYISSTQNYIDLVDSEDEELERAIRASVLEFEEKR